MDITFLQAQMPLQKRFDEHGKHSYPQAYEFTSHTLAFNTLKSFHFATVQQANAGLCLLKGNVTRELTTESRAGTTDRDAFTQWLCFDADGITSVADAEAFLSALGLSGFPYVLQWSSSAFLRRDGVTNTDFNAHIFMFLSEPVSPHRLKLWLKQMNFQAFKSDLKLTASDMTLRFGLDITTCQNDKLLFIAPPNVSEPYEDTITDARITYHAGEPGKNFIPVHLLFLDDLDPEKIKKQELDIINDLRMEKGLDKKRATNFNLKGTIVEYLANPSKATITDTKEDRGFVYFNLNGGDSWAYYHPIDNFEYIYNFKGEPAYKTDELLPEYHAFKTKSQGLERAAGRLAIAFRGLQDGCVYNGFYDEELEEVELYMARRAQDALIFLEEYGIELEALPTYRLMHDPHHTGGRIDFEKKEIHLYVQSPLERAAIHDSSPTPTIDKIISHVLGTDNVRHFINWVAYVVQTKKASGTGWVFHGTQGTGKGILFHRILRPMVGAQNAIQLRTANFEDSYNGFLENSTLINVDEVNIPEARRDRQIMDNLKNYMTEPTVSIRKMHANVYEVLNRTNWIFSSNQRNPIVVEMADRRFNIADYQPHPMKFSDEEMKTLTKELPIFMYHILSYPVNENQAQTSGMTTAKINMQSLSETSVDEIANALIHGRAHVLYNYCEDEAEVLDLDHRIVIQRYNALVKAIVCEGLNRFTRSDLRTLFESTVGKIPNTPAKFTKYLRHHGINVGINRVNGKAERGSLIVEWEDDDDWFTRTQREYGVMKSIPHSQEHKNDGHEQQN